VLSFGVRLLSLRLHLVAARLNSGVRRHMDCTAISFCSLDPNAQAAWVQAVGSVIAIFAAIAIGERSSRQARQLVLEERDRQSTIIAASLGMRTHMLGVECQKRAETSQQLHDDLASGKVATINIEQLHGMLLLQQHVQVVELQNQTLHLDKDNGILSNLLIDTASSYNPTTSVMLASAFIRNNPQQAVLEAILETKSRLLALLHLCNESERLLETTHKLDGPEK